MTKAQIGLLGSAIVLFAIIYFGGNTKSPTQKQAESTRVFSATSTDINVLLKEAKKKLAAQDMNSLDALEHELTLSESDSSASLKVLMSLSGLWFKLNHPAISGHYAELIAGQLQTEDAWSKAGTTYAICVQREKEDKVLQFCTDNAVAAFEKASSINPDNLAHKVNLAVVYAENPPKEDVMRGVTMLLDMNRNYPDNIAVLNNLGRLAIKTGQFDRALARLEKVLSLDSNNPVAICLLADAYQGLNQPDRASAFAERCRQFSNNN